MTLTGILFFLGLNLALLAIYAALTRIARALEDFNEKFSSLDRQTISQAVDQLSWEAGRSFEHGRRIDR